MSLRNATRVPCTVAVWLSLSSTVSAQSIAAGDSLARQVAAHATDSVRVSLRDGDYASLAITHPSGLEVWVGRPNGEELRLFALPTMKGTSPIAFVAEGGGSYTIRARNTSDGSVPYGLRFIEHTSLDERTRPVPIADEVTSPRIEALRRRAQTGDTGTAQFWSQGSARVQRHPRREADRRRRRERRRLRRDVHRARSSRGVRQCPQHVRRVLVVARA